MFAHIFGAVPFQMPEPKYRPPAPPELPSSPCDGCAHRLAPHTVKPCCECGSGERWEPELPAEGTKHDQGKLPLHLIAPELNDALGEILAFGAGKYGDRNWEKGMAWHRPFSACLRHLWAWWRDAGPDPETGKSHLWHAACCVMFLIAYEARGIGEDDRPKGVRDAEQISS